MEYLSKDDIPPGFLLIDKEEGPTSHDMVNRARRILEIKRIGHAGTLDPFATGLLVLCIEKATLLSQYLVKKEKVYIFTLILGAASNTYDKTGTISPNESFERGEENNPGENSLKNVLKEFTGEIKQVPPVFSAIKKNGRRLFDYARKGENVEIKPRKVIVHSLSLLNYRYPEVVLEAKVSSGTYIRSLGHDIGKRLGTDAYVESLRRVSVGSFHVSQAFSLSDVLEKKIIKRHIIGIRDMFKEWPRIAIGGDALERVLKGNAISSRGIYTGRLEEDEMVLIVDQDKREICMAKIKQGKDDWMIQPKRMLIKDLQ